MLPKVNFIRNCRSANTSVKNELPRDIKLENLLIGAQVVMIPKLFEVSFNRRFGKRKRCCFGRIHRNSQCQWPDARCTLEFDDGRINGTTNLLRRVLVLLRF